MERTVKTLVDVGTGVGHLHDKVDVLKPVSDSVWMKKGINFVGTDDSIHDRCSSELLQIPWTS